MNEIELQRAFGKVRSGDREAFSDIYRDLSRPVYTVALRIVRRRDIAEDITQDVFVRLFVSPPDASVRCLRAWIFRMARNLAIDVMRAQHITQSEEALTELADGDEAERLATRLDIASAMEALPQIEREIVALHVHGELGFGEIGRIVGLSLPATYRRYRKALGKLREELGGTR